MSGLRKRFQQRDTILDTATQPEFQTTEAFAKRRTEIAPIQADIDQRKAAILELANRDPDIGKLLGARPGRDFRELVWLRDKGFTFGIVNDEVNRARGTEGQAGLMTADGREVSPENPPVFFTPESVGIRAGLGAPAEPKERQLPFVRKDAPGGQEVIDVAELGVPFTPAGRGAGTQLKTPKPTPSQNRRAKRWEDKTGEWGQIALDRWGEEIRGAKTYYGLQPGSNELKTAQRDLANTNQTIIHLPDPDSGHVKPVIIGLGNETAAREEYAPGFGKYVIDIKREGSAKAQATDHELFLEYLEFERENSQ